MLKNMNWKEIDNELMGKYSMPFLTPTYLPPLFKTDGLVAKILNDDNKRKELVSFINEKINEYVDEGLTIPEEINTDFGTYKKLIIIKILLN